MEINTTSEQSIKESIAKIANELIVNKALKINNKIFSFIDIEFYYWHQNHPDEFANGVNHDKPKGELEAHRYGIDLSLGNIKDLEFGGILICGLYDFENDRIIEKHLIKRTLFNSFKIGENNIELITHPNRWNVIFHSKRKNLGTANTENKKKYVDSHYKFLVKDSEIFKKYKNKESIFRNSTLTDLEIKSLLGYNFTR